jgi:hypothetical protein
MSETTGEISIMIKAPVSTVYDYLVDFTRHNEWVYNLTKVRQVSPGSIGVGTVFQAQEGPPPLSLPRKLRMMVYFIAGLATGTKPYSQAEITSLESRPGGERRIAWRAGLPKGEGWFNVAEWEFILRPQAQATYLTQRFRYKPQTAAAARMVSAAGDGGLERACAVSLERLKVIMEQRTAQGA